jgi:adenylate cyclase
MRPFKQGDSLTDHAMPMGEILSQLQSQLAEFRALKGHLDLTATGAPDPATRIGLDLETPSNQSSGTNSKASSNIHLLLSPPSPER